MTLNEEKAEHLSCWSQDKVGETKLTLVGDLAHVAQRVKSLPAMQETQAQSLG